jgi:hypothetical protein
MRPDTASRSGFGTVQHAHPTPSRQIRKHRQHGVGFEEHDRGEAEAPRGVAIRDEGDWREQNTPTPS